MSGSEDNTSEFGSGIFGIRAISVMPMRATQFDPSDGQNIKLAQSHIIKPWCPGAHLFLLFPSNSLMALPVLNSTVSINSSSATSALLLLSFIWRIFVPSYSFR